MLYSLAAIDLDGTLIGPDLTISQANVEAVERLREAGVTIVLTSGRHHRSIAQYHKQLSLNSPIISCQGAFTYNVLAGNAISEIPLSDTIVDLVLANAKTQDVTLLYFCAHGCLTNAKGKLKDIYDLDTGFELTTVNNVSEMAAESAHKILWSDQPERVFETLERLDQRIREDSYITFTRRSDQHHSEQPRHIEFLSPAANKGSALAALSNLMGIQRECIVAFGDANNDVPMLQWAGLGVAMSHADQTALDAADLVGPQGEIETNFARAVNAVFELS